jgi:hypothetical protein
MSELLEKLSAPFAPATVSWRLGPTNADKTRGLPLAYIDSRDVQDRLNDVCGTDWQVRFPWAIPGKMTCEIGIKIDAEWIWRGDGAGDSDVEAEKGAFSDAFKRAAVRWGIGRYLYDVDAPWVALEKRERGGGVFIPDNELARLRAILMRPTPAATRDATSALAEIPRGNWKLAERNKGASPDPPSPGDPETLSQIRDRIHRALTLANEKLTPDLVLQTNEDDLALIKEASEKTYNNLLAYAEQRKAELVTAPRPGPLRWKVAERLGA